MIAAGKIDQPITIESATMTDDGMGAQTETWAAVSGAPKWAEYIPISGLEKVTAGKLEIDTNLKLKIRRNTSVTQKCRVTHGSKTYRITGIDDYYRDNYLILYCSEIK